MHLCLILSLKSLQILQKNSRRNSPKHKIFTVGVIEVGIYQSDVFLLPSAMWRQTRRRRTETKKQDTKETKKKPSSRVFCYYCGLLQRFSFFPISDPRDAPSKYRVVLPTSISFRTWEQQQITIHARYFDALDKRIGRIRRRTKT